MKEFEDDELLFGDNEEESMELDFDEVEDDFDEVDDVDFDEVEDYFLDDHDEDFEYEDKEFERLVRENNDNIEEVEDSDIF